MINWIDERYQGFGLVEFSIACNSRVLERVEGGRTVHSWGFWVGSYLCKRSKVTRKRLKGKGNWKETKEMKYRK